MDLLLTRASDWFARAVLLCVMCQGFTKWAVMGMAAQNMRGNLQVSNHPNEY